MGRRIINTLRKPTTTPTKLAKESGLVSVFMAGQRITRRQKDISRLLRERKYNPRQQSKKITNSL